MYDFLVQVHAMEGMVLSFQVGIVEVRAVHYQTTCLAQPQMILAVLESRLPQLASGKCDQLGTEIKVIEALIFTRTLTLFTRSLFSRFLVLCWSV